MNTNTDISLVYLSLLFILTLFNLLTTFIYCSKNRLHSQPDSNCEEELKQVKILGKMQSSYNVCFRRVMIHLAIMKLWPMKNYIQSKSLQYQLIC